jgi:DNA-binding MarR family transcriptional regulator
MAAASFYLCANTMGTVTKLSQAKAAQLWEGLDRAHNAMTAALEKDMVPQAGIPLGWYEVLMHLSRAPGGLLRYQDLARVAGITDSGASRRLDQIVKAGLIERRSCPTDRRGVYAHMTAKGKTAFERAHGVYLRSLDRNLGSHVGDDEADAISAALARLT